jgi:protein FrlC
MDHTGYLGLELLDRRYVMDPESAMRRALEWYAARL